MPITVPRSEIADLLTTAIAKATGLQPHQIETVTADPGYIQVTYTGPEPGMAGGHGRQAVRTYNTKTGALISDHLLNEPTAVDLVGHLGASIDAARARRLTGTTGAKP